MRLRAQDLAIAADTRFHDKAMNVAMSTEALYAHFGRQLGKRHLAILYKPRSDVPWFERATTLPGAVCVGHSWDDKRVIDKNATLAEEIPHSLQWRYYERFGRRYLFDPGFRLAVEVQAKCEVVWAYACQGWRGEALDSVIDALVDGVCSAYLLWRLRGKKDAARTVFVDTKERAVRILSLTNKGKTP